MLRRVLRVVLRRVLRRRLSVTHNFELRFLYQKKMVGCCIFMHPRTTGETEKGTSKPSLTSLDKLWRNQLQQVSNPITVEDADSSFAKLC